MAFAALVDAGPLIALGDQRDDRHALSLRFFRDFDGPLHTTWPVLTEVSHMLSNQAAVRFLRTVLLGNIEVHDVPQSVLGKIADTMEKYADLPMDLADASLVWLADETGIRDIATFDEKDFAVYRLSGGKRFNNLLAKRRR
jgi:predicted nucleic acid-binding protein